LKKYLKDGNKIRPEGIIKVSSLSHRKREEVMDIMDEVPTHMLRKIYTELDKSVSYSELRIIQLYYMAMNNK
jgi:ATP-dependent DNA helicase RecQ